MIEFYNISAVAKKCVKNTILLFIVQIPALNLMIANIEALASDDAVGMLKQDLEDLRGDINTFIHSMQQQQHEAEGEDVMKDFGVEDEVEQEEFTMEEEVEEELSGEEEKKEGEEEKGEAEKMHKNMEENGIILIQTFQKTTLLETHANNLLCNHDLW